MVQGLPRSLDRVVARGLERDPSKRYGTAREMAAELAACVTVPSSGQVGEWVETAAGDVLRERAQGIAAIERVAAEAEDSVLGRGGSEPRGLGGSHPVSAPSAANDVWQPPTSVDVSSRRRARTVAASVVGVVGLAALSLVLGVILKRAPASHVLAEASATATRVVAPVAIASAILDVAGVDVPPAAAASATTPPSALKARRSTSTAIAEAVHKTAGSSSAPTAQDCVPPYTTDAKGHVHFKPNCL
jgi:serine/threonine-protein kinase